jgi:ADP-heptose:LPS heptosyltransferase
LNARFAQNEWRLLQAERQPAAAAGGLARAVADAFMENFFSQGRIRLRYIDLLCEMAVHPDPGICRLAVQSLYGTIVEGLCDDFSEQGVSTCNQVLLRVLAIVTRHPQGKDIATLLAQFKVKGPAALLDRYERSRRPKSLSEGCRQKVSKVLILSRISAGADIVITSIIVQRLQAAFPESEILLLGPEHLAEFFDCPHLRWLRVDYQRRGSLFDRLHGWPQIVRLVAREAEGLGENSLVVFDPDTRLSQLGLLPLTDEHRTCYFSSRTNPFPDRNPSLPELTNTWLDQLLAEQTYRAPAVFLSLQKIGILKGFGERLRRAGARRVLVVNLGVGNDQRKRIAGTFEEELLATILQREAHTVIVLDTGGDSEEKERIGMLLRAMQGSAIPVAFITEEEIAHRDAPFSHGVIGFRGSLGALGGLLLMADAYFGYDSCGQHLASALGTPAVILFAGAPNPRFLSRWRSPVPTTMTIPVAQTELSPTKKEELSGRVAGNLHKLWH